MMHEERSPGPPKPIAEPQATHRVSWLQMVGDLGRLVYGDADLSDPKAERVPVYREGSWSLIERKVLKVGKKVFRTKGETGEREA